MKRRYFLSGISAAVLTSCRGAGRPRINVFNWSSYIGPNTIENFTRETGIQVRYGIFENGEELLAKVLTGNSGWDVVFPTNHHVKPLIDYGLLAPLRHDALGNLDMLDERFRRPAWDPDLRYSVPYMSTSAGIVYNRQVHSLPVTSWADLWSPALSGKMTMLDAQDDVLGACLAKLGYPWNSTSERELRAAQREAIAQKKLLRAYLNAEVRDQVVAGDVHAAQMWATTMLPAMETAPHLEWVYPREGFVSYAESAVLLRESPRSQWAHQFMDYLLRPEVAAECVKAEKTGPVLRGVRELLPTSLQGHPVLFPDRETLARGVWLETMPPAIQRLRDRLWTEIKAS